LSGSEFHKTGAAYLNELLPYLDDFTCGICNRFVPCLGIFAQKLIRRKLKRYRKELYVLFTRIMRHLMKTYSISTPKSLTTSSHDIFAVPI
jgi:hypothetical protein